MYFIIAGAHFAIIFHNILHYFAHDKDMDFYRELALESAKTASALSDRREKKMSRRVRLASFRAEQAFGPEGEERENGEYHTLLINGNLPEISDLSEEVSKDIAEVLSPLLKGRRHLLVVGLGNPKMVVDALGSETVAALPTGDLCGRYLSALTPSVFGVTGLESASVVRGVVKETSPDLVLAVDTLATRKADRLFRAVQIGNVGISPGGGVGNRRESLSRGTLGVPVISLGVPLLAHADLCSSLPAGLVVTPKEIDILVPAFARCLATGIEWAL